MSRSSRRTSRCASSPSDIKNCSLQIMMSRNTNKPSRSRRRSNDLHSSRGGTAEKMTYRGTEIPIQPPPNVIARLMGVDAIPIPTPPPKPAPIIQPPTSSLRPPPPATPENEIMVVSPRSAPFKQAKCSSLLSYRSRNNGGGDSGSSGSHCLKKTRVPRSRQRRHPQEDLLQKMKQDFQAWQTSRALVDDCSATTVAAFGKGNTPTPSKDLESRRVQMIAQENLRKQKMARYGFANSKKVMENENSLKNPEILRQASPCAAAASQKSGDSDHSATDEELLQSRTQILLLKPTSSDGRQEPLFGLPKVERDGNMTRFLQEIKEMLQKELGANATRSELPNATTCWGTEAKQSKETAVSKHDHGKRLFRSESFRGFRSDRKRKEATAKNASPEHVRIVARNILAHRKLKSVASPKKDDEESMSSCSITSRERVRSLADDVSPSNRINGLGEQSFRSECLMKHKDDDRVSPARALFRSFSAPELGFSLGRLFIGDGSVRRSATPTHEASGIASEGAASMTSKNNTAFGFIRGTVSSLRHSFSLRRNLLFRRKTHWEIHPQVAIGTTPSPPETTFNLFKVAQANLTELPPSPVSPLEVVAGHSCRHFFNDFNCTLPPELMSPKCLSEFEAPTSELSCSRTDITVETVSNLDKAYIREVLVAAGLYDDGSLDSKAIARVDSMARPICDDIFEEVEDVYYYRGRNCDDAIGGVCSDAGGSATDHRTLFDLANEALLSLVQGAKAGSSLRQWVIDSTGVSRGRRLVDDVWQQVQTLRNPQMQEMQTIDSMVAYEIRNSAWAEVLYEDAYVVGRKIERAIFDQLIEDLLVEVFI